LTFSEKQSLSTHFSVPIRDFLLFTFPLRLNSDEFASEHVTVVTLPLTNSSQFNHSDEFASERVTVVTLPLTNSSQFNHNGKVTNEKSQIGTEKWVESDCFSENVN